MNSAEFFYDPTTVFSLNTRESIYVVNYVAHWSSHIKCFPLIGSLQEQIVLRGNFKAIGRRLKLLQFQNKNFKTKWHVGSGWVGLTESPESNIRPN